MRSNDTLRVGDRVTTLYDLEKYAGTVHLRKANILALVQEIRRLRAVERACEAWKNAYHAHDYADCAPCDTLAAAPDTEGGTDG